METQRIKHLGQVHLDRVTAFLSTLYNNTISGQMVHLSSTDTIMYTIVYKRGKTHALINHVSGTMALA